MEAMRRAVRYALAGLVFSAVTIPGSGTSSAAAPRPDPAFAVAAVRPAPGQVVGVGYPVTVTFTKPIADRATAERTISITATKSMTGRFNWVKDDTVQWVPDGFWPAHGKVTVLAGGAPTQFGTGAAVVGVANISAHTFTVSIDGQVAREMPASMGKPTRPTPVGNFSI
ncbi:MAG: hypothetical protein QOE41_4205, partial [Mycobacterium sp.]|nr:hypothetical protein [Mycobacterium sp.]